MNTEQTKSNKNPHHLSMQERKSLELHGITDVLNFDEQSVVLCTTCGTLAIDGEGLHIHVLSIEQGIVTLDGKIDSISYYDSDTSEKGEKSGFFGKLFR